MTELQEGFIMMGIQNYPLVDFQGGYFKKGQIILFWVAISGKGCVEKAKYHPKKKPYIEQSDKLRESIRLALVNFDY